MNCISNLLARQIDDRACATTLSLHHHDSTANMEDKQLFGGAIACALPFGYTDVSDIRPVPDNQEVFTNIDADASFIFEVLEREDVLDQAAAQHFLHDLLEYQDATVDVATTKHFDIQIPAAHLSNDGTPAFVDGICAVAAISKYKEAARNRVLVLAAVIRLPTVETDLLVSHNVPLYIAPNSSSSASSSSAALAQTSSYLNPGLDEASRVLAAQAAFQQLLATLIIKDWGLFGGGDMEE